MLGAIATSAPCKTAVEGSRDVEAEAAALSLARRRGKCAPSVDTKLADAWLGFYVALTKSSSRSTEATTQASTEASLSDMASSGGPSPRHAVPDGELEEPVSAQLASEPLTGNSLRESWADASEEQSPSPKKRSRRSHRRRRTRGRGKKGRKAGADDCPEEDCEPIDEEDDGPASTNVPELVSCGSPTAVTASPCHAHITPAGVMSTSFLMPTVASKGDAACPQAIVFPPTEALPLLEPCSSPSKACNGSIGMLVTSTSPNALLTPTHCEASARTPPRTAFANSPVVHMIPSTPTAFGLTYQGGHAAYQGSHMMLSSPGGVCVGSPCQGQGGMVQPPTFFGNTLASPQGPLPVPPEICTAPLPPNAMVNPSVDAMRLFLAGGVSTNEDLAIRLQAAAPESYED